MGAAPPVAPAEAEPAKHRGPVDEVLASGSESEDRVWRLSLLWTLGATVVYLGLAAAGRTVFASSKEGTDMIAAQVPNQIYLMSCAAFFSAMIINATSLVFETSSSKRQLALLGCFIKAAACYSDLLIAMGAGIIMVNEDGRPVNVSRYIQWLVTTPTMLLLLSRLSDFSNKQVFATLLINSFMIVTGLVASMSNSTLAVAAGVGSYVAFCFVMKAAAGMVQGALGVQNDADARRGLKAILYTTIVVWTAFPVAWLLDRTGLLSIFSAEMLIMVANFGAKVLFSSSVMYGNFITIAQRKVIAKEIEEHANRLQMVEDLKKAVKTKEEFMSMVSHELRTPLNGIIGLSEAILGLPGINLTEKGEKYMKTIKNSSHHLANIINDILDAASLKKGKLVLKLEKVHMSKVVEHVLDIATQLAKKKVTVEKRVDPATPVIVADGSRVQQILYNLVGNSLKFTLEGKITVTVKPGPNDCVLMIVQDTGCGIPKDKHQVIFEAFGQGDMSTTRKYGGTGLGLSIVSQLVEAHGGTITMESEIGKGSTFTVSLPIKQAETDNRASLDLSRTASIMESEAANQHRSFDLNDRMGNSKSPKGVAFNMTADATSKPASTSPSTSSDNDGRGEARGFSLEMARTSLPGCGIPTSIRPSLGDNFAMAQQSSLYKPSRKSMQGSRRNTMSGLATTKDGMLIAGFAKPTHSEYHSNDDGSNGPLLILSVDDEPVNHMVVEDVLQSGGYKVHTELDGREALTWISQQEWVPDLILLDCMMPNMSGHEFLKELRNTHKIPQSLVPVIMVSAKNDETNVVEGLRNGCNDFVSKPIKRAELLARISAHVRSTQEATWMSSLMDGALKDDGETMRILKSILPDRIITRIQEGHKVIGDGHAHVVILFSDIVGFSSMSAKKQPREVFELLTSLYGTFDTLTDKYGVYKVETIGDGYMIAAGHEEDPAKTAMGRPIERIYNMAQAMLEAVQNFTNDDPNDRLRIRVGIHCGPAYSGLIGMKCPRYCFLGDTVNTASRMESNGFPMCIHVSQAVVDDLQRPDAFAALGERQIKGKGKMYTYVAKVQAWEEALADFQNSKSASSGVTPELVTPEAQILMKSHFETRNGSVASFGPAAAAANAEVLEAKLAEASAAFKAEHELRVADAEAAGSLQVELQSARSQLAAEKKLLQMAQEELLRVTANASSADNKMIVAHRLLHDSGGMHSYSVRMLLEDLGLEGYAAGFEAHDVPLELLLTMEPGDMKELGVHQYGHRQVIRTGILEYVKQFLRSCEADQRHNGHNGQNGASRPHSATGFSLAHVHEH
ncbi:hypothetical protein WJX72_001553 [[Myrmecia] bisecta]|uniref:histidine kinase n=1 Tax=[Myrmecia] bisecta TaxID=41462 RepID=A0AAW1R4K6_9CHLO